MRRGNCPRADTGSSEETTARRFNSSGGGEGGTVSMRCADRVDVIAEGHFGVQYRWRGRKRNERATVAAHSESACEHVRVSSADDRPAGDAPEHQATEDSHGAAWR